MAGQRANAEREFELQERANRVAFCRDLWLERLVVYRQVAATVGAFLAELDDSVQKRTVNEFLAAYWGPMLLVEDEAVRQAMIRLHGELRDFQRARSSPERLKQRADTLVQAFKTSLKEGGRCEETRTPKGPS